MTSLPDLFSMLNSKGLTLARLGDRIKIKGQTGAIAPEIIQAIAENKAQLLPLLPDTAPTPEVGQVAGDSEAQEEAEAVQAEALGQTTVARTLQACEEWDQLVEARNWRDWRLDWLAEWGVFHVRLRHADDPKVRQALGPLANLPIPQNLAEWATQRQQIDAALGELTRQGHSVSFPWPRRGDE
ncbi:MAG: hypothetical protein U0840_29285 [Gemmataceae bacterium]